MINVKLIRSKENFDYVKFSITGKAQGETLPCHLGLHPADLDTAWSICPRSKFKTRAGKDISAVAHKALAFAVADALEAAAKESE